MSYLNEFPELKEILMSGDNDKKIFLNIEEYIFQHKHVQYCEIFIHPSGLIENLRSSHTNDLIYHYFGIDLRFAETEEYVKVHDQIPRNVNAMEWLINQTNIVAIYYSQAICPRNMTDIQKHAIQRLIDSKIVDFTSNDHRLCIGRRHMPPGIIIAEEWNKK